MRTAKDRHQLIPLTTTTSSTKGGGVLTSYFRRRTSASRRRRGDASDKDAASAAAWVLMAGMLVVVVFVGCCCCCYYYYSHPQPLGTPVSEFNRTKLSSIAGQPCALNLYGLPRQFRDLVLPGLVQNVIRPNARYKCDYFVHYYSDTRQETDYRGADRGRGGRLDPEEVRLLAEAVRDAHKDYFVRHPWAEDGIDAPLPPAPTVEFIHDTENSFFQQYDPLLHKIFNERGEDGRLLYIPLSEKEPFPNATLVNIVKMFHSQQSVWNLMEPSPARTSGEDQQRIMMMPSSISGPKKHYSRVAMLRSDILYVTPIDIYQLPDGSMDLRNEYAVIPSFGNFPVNDRFFAGPADAVQIWAAGRFRRLPRHVQRVAPTGDGLHPERFLHHTVFPAVRDAGVPILHGGMCFLRVRADRSVRIGDCGRGCVTEHNRRAVEHLLQRPCLLNRTNPDVAFLECRDGVVRGDAHDDERLSSLAEAITWEPCPWKV